MSFSTIFAQGTAVVSVPASQSIVVQAQNDTQIFQEVGFPQMPTSQTLLGTILSGTSVFGPFTNATNITITAGAGGALYAVGVSPVITNNGNWQPQAASAVIADGGSMLATAANLINSIITATPTAARNIQLPTAANIDLSVSIAINESFDFTVLTLAAFALTLTVNTGVTIVGNPATAATSGSAAMFRGRKTAVATYEFTRIS